VKFSKNFGRMKNIKESNGPANPHLKISKKPHCRASGLLAFTSSKADSKRELLGTYSDKQLLSVKRLTLPRVHVYDESGHLIERSQWPAELNGVKSHAGETFCCVSEQPSPPGSSGPPADCKIIVYGADVHEHFVELRTSSGAPIRYSDLPPHKYLIVDYFADWCAPCIPARRELEAFMKTKEGADYALVIVDFSRLPKAQELARQAGSGQ
jgi:thiol-disulfide isomerase/thioredoxin